MRSTEEVKITRDVEAVVIPAGNRILIPQGVTVSISQALGGSYSVVTPQGYLARISGHDADALGKEPTVAPPVPESAASGGPRDAHTLEQEVWDVLREVYDPEIPVNIVDLGLIYECTVRSKESGAWVGVKMTMTAPGCGMGDVLKADAEARIRDLPGVDRADVEIVWDPPWDQSRMSEAARLELGFG